MIIGIDLAGPKNHTDTAISFIEDKNIKVYSGFSDDELFNFLFKHKAKYVGIDAPLSYSQQGGYRESDRDLRTYLNSFGFTKIGVMPPTYSRMIYLTSRGIRLTRLFSFLDIKPILYECHPGAFLALDNYNYEDVLLVKKSIPSINNLIKAIEIRGYTFKIKPKNDHEIMSVAVALAVESKINGKIHWESCKKDIDGYPFIA
ncbi:DUF429 domain-containing protein [Thiospirochaeta perfilievii]|uniref:DUF429 domain-containing protein n=1 Tax=Thiospirochaeta perfilievii TaxID=252967 RepID=A0A5C1QGC9_9SPIO|nr:DUF429 domain-containing protein [Thiospirochaeta perfilievii]QEN05272.1 DUF429 domain-containing protein [Thiospirochaeta perfilievii]